MFTRILSHNHCGIKIIQKILIDIKIFLHTTIKY